MKKFIRIIIFHPFPFISRQQPEQENFSTPRRIFFRSIVFSFFCSHSRRESRVQGHRIILWEIQFNLVLSEKFVFLFFLSPFKKTFLLAFLCFSRRYKNHFCVRSFCVNGRRWGKISESQKFSVFHSRLDRVLWRKYKYTRKKNSLISLHPHLKLYLQSFSQLFFLIRINFPLFLGQSHPSLWFNVIQGRYPRGVSNFKLSLFSIKQIADVYSRLSEIFALKKYYNI